MALLETKSRQMETPARSGGLSQYRDRELYSSGNYELVLEDINLNPTNTHTSMFVVVCPEAGVYNHYLIKSNLSGDSIEMVKALNALLKERFPNEVSNYTKSTAYELVILKEEYLDSMVSTVAYSARNGYKLNSAKVDEAFDRAVAKGLIDKGAVKSDYTLVDKDGESTYFTGHAPGNVKRYNEAGLLKEAEFVPFVRTYLGQIILEERGSVVSKTKPDSRYQIYQTVLDSKIYICDMTTDRKGVRSIDIAKAGKEYVPESLAAYLLEMFKHKY